MYLKLPDLYNVIEYASKFHFTKILLWISVITAITLAFKKESKDPIYITLKVYLGTELILGLVDNIISTNPNISSDTIGYFINYSNILIALVEFDFFQKLHKKTFGHGERLINSVFRYFLFLSALVVVIYTAIIDSSEILKLTYFLGSIEFLFIFYYSFDFFRSLVNKIPETDLFEKGSFWCFLGSLFYCSVSAPFYIVGPNFPTGIETFDTLLPALLYYLPYSILFFCISIALKCKTHIWN